MEEKWYLECDDSDGTTRTLDDQEDLSEKEKKQEKN